MEKKMKILLIHSFYRKIFPSGENIAVNELKNTIDSKKDGSRFAGHSIVGSND